MKKKALLVILLILSAVLVFSACSEKAESISIKTPPKTEYLIGEELDLTDGVIEVVYPSKTRDINMTASSVHVEGFSSETAGKVTLTVTYAKLVTYLDIYVINPEPQLISVTIKTLPSLEGYYVGDTFDFTGGVLLLGFDDGSGTELPMTHAAVSPVYNFSQAGDALVVLSYKNFEVSFTVNVMELVLDSVEVKSYPVKTEYQIGDTIDLTGGVIRLNYGNDRSSDIEMTLETVSAEYNFANLGDTSVKIKYLENEFVYAVTVSEAEQILKLVEVYHKVNSEGVATGVLVGDNGPYFALEKLYVDIANSIFDSGNKDIINRLSAVTVYKTETLLRWYYLFAEEHEYLLNVFIAPLGEDYLEFFVDYLNTTINWLEAGGSLVYATELDRGLYPEFDSDVESLVAKYHALSHDVQLEFFVAFNLITSYGTICDNHYQYVLSAQEFEIYKNLFEAKVVYIMYATGHVSVSEFFQYMEICIEDYEGLNNKTNFNGYFCGTEYVYYKDLYDELQMIVTVELISELVKMAQTSYDNREGFWFYYAYYHLKLAVNKLYAAQNQKYIEEYEASYKADFEAIIKIYYNTIYRPGFDDVDFVEFMAVFFEMAYNFENDDSYGAKSEKFVYDYEIMSLMFDALSLEKRVYFSRVLGETYYYYFYMTLEYYSQFLNEEEIQTLKHFLNAYIMYINCLYDGSRMNDFLLYMGTFMESRNALDDATNFDNYFAWKCEQMLELNKLAVYEELIAIYSMMNGVSQGLIFMMYYGDCTYFMYYYPLIMSMIDAVLNSGNADLIAGFETVKFGGFPLSEYYLELLDCQDIYDMYLEEVEGKSYESFFWFYVNLVGKWIESGGSETGISDRELYPEFDNDVALLNEMFNQLSITDQYAILDLADVMLLWMSQDHYYNVLGAEGYAAFQATYFARQEYVICVAQKLSMSSFLYKMSVAIEEYEKLSEENRELFDLHFGYVYSYYLKLFEGLVESSAHSNVALPSYEAIVNYKKRTITA